MTAAENVYDIEIDALVDRATKAAKHMMTESPSCLRSTDGVLLCAQHRALVRESAEHLAAVKEKEPKRLEIALKMCEEAGVDPHMPLTLQPDYVQRIGAAIYNVPIIYRVPKPAWWMVMKNLPLIDELEASGK